MKIHTISLATLLALLPLACALHGEEPAAKKDSTVSLADGKLTLTAPEGWVRKAPRTRIVDAEFAIPAVEGDEIDGRLTVMGAGGSVQANIDRWVGQFTQPDGKPTKDKAIIEKKELAGQTVHTVDLSGTYKDQAGPFAPAVERENYRMLAAIVVTENDGQYFLKLYGPRKTIAENEKAFADFVSSLKMAKTE